MKLNALPLIFLFAIAGCSTKTASNAPTADSSSEIENIVNQSLFQTNMQIQTESTIESADKDSNEIDSQFYRWTKENTTYTLTAQEFVKDIDTSSEPEVDYTLSIENDTQKVITGKLGYGNTLEVTDVTDQLSDDYLKSIFGWTFKITEDKAEIIPDVFEVTKDENTYVITLKDQEAYNKLDSSFEDVESLVQKIHVKDEKVDSVETELVRNIDNKKNTIVYTSAFTYDMPDTAVMDEAEQLENAQTGDNLTIDALVFDFE